MNQKIKGKERVAGSILESKDKRERKGCRINMSFGQIIKEEKMIAGSIILTIGKREKNDCGQHHFNNW